MGHVIAMTIIGWFLWECGLMVTVWLLIMTDAKETDMMTRRNGVVLLLLWPVLLAKLAVRGLAWSCQRLKEKSKKWTGTNWDI